MSWQEAVFTLGPLFFAAGLLPSLRGPDKPALRTSIITGFWLTLFVPAYATLGLVYAAAVTALTAACWWTLAWQRHQLG